MQQSLSEVLSPLCEAEPLSLDLLFSRAVKSVTENDTLNAAIIDLQDEEFANLIAFYRAEAVRFAKSEADGSRPAKAKITKADAKAAQVESNLEDLL